MSQTRMGEDQRWSQQMLGPSTHFTTVWLYCQNLEHATTKVRWHQPCCNDTYGDGTWSNAWRDFASTGFRPGIERGSTDHQTSCLAIHVPPRQWREATTTSKWRIAELWLDDITHRYKSSITLYDLRQTSRDRWMHKIKGLQIFWLHVANDTRVKVPLGHSRTSNGFRRKQKRNFQIFKLLHIFSLWPSICWGPYQKGRPVASKNQRLIEIHLCHSQQKYFIDASYNCTFKSMGIIV